MSSISGLDLSKDGLVLLFDMANVKSYDGASTIYDLSQNGYNGATSSGTTKIDDYFGGLQFNNSYLNFGNILNDVITGNSAKFSIICVFRTDSYSTNGQAIVSKYADRGVSEGNRQFALRVRDIEGTYGFKIEVAYGGGGLNPGDVNLFIFDKEINIGEVNHFIFTFDATETSAINKVGLYLNGEQLSKTTYLNNNNSNIVSSNAILTSGAMVNIAQTSSTGYLDGSIYFLAIYNRFLSDSEKEQNYESMRNRYKSSIKTDGIVLYLDSTNENSYFSNSLTWYDLSGNGNNGTLENGITFSDLKLDFDGVDDYVSLGKSFIDSGDIGSGDVSYTMEAWIYLDVAPISNFVLGGFSIIGNASADGIGMQLFSDGYSGAKVNFGGRSNSNFSSISSLSISTWYHIVCTREVGNNNRIYINGELDNTYAIANLDVNNTTAEMQIGFSDTRVDDYYFNGKIPIVRLYNTYLTDYEVLRNYNSDRHKFGV